MSALFDVRSPSEEVEGTRSQVLRWLKAPGARVAANEPLVELDVRLALHDVMGRPGRRPTRGGLLSRRLRARLGRSRRVALL